MLIDIFVITAVMIAAFVLVRTISLTRGGRRRDERVLALLAPLRERLTRGEGLQAAEVRQAAEAPEVRPLLHALLAEHEALELFPAEFLEAAEQARALVAYWMMHPAEMQEAPVEIVAERIVPRRVGGRDAEFHVLRFRMRAEHWTAGAWLLGVAGPFHESDRPFASSISAIARGGDLAGACDPLELVDWFAGTLRGRKA